MNCSTLSEKSPNVTKSLSCTCNNISRWIEKNNAPVKYVDELKSYIYQNGVKNEGNIWMVDDISVVIDEDCMDEIESHDIRYLILRSDCNLYRKWNDKSTIVNI